mmetsp:Transcript_34491/g.78726  ORF Transcript_34491/g.78726 Transcript_34491/m.78726 type:complete len:883 (+) Transcript_34491:54-2702(+)
MALPVLSGRSDGLEHRPRAVVCYQRQHTAHLDSDEGVKEDVVATLSPAGGLGNPARPRQSSARTLTPGSGASTRRRWRSAPKEVLLSVAITTTTFLGGGLIFGFSPLAGQLVRLPGSPFTEANVSSVLSVGHNITVVGLILSGLLLDKFGPRVCAVSGLLIEAVGHFGMLHAEDMPQWITWTSYGLIGLGGTQVLIAALTFADGFQHSGLVNSALTAFYQAGGFVFMILPYVSWGAFFRTYVLLSLVAAVATLLVYPDRPLAAYSGSDEHSEIADISAAIANSRSLKSIVMRPGTLMFLLTFMVAGSALIYGQSEFVTGTRAKAGCLWEEGKFMDCKYEDLYQRLNNIYFPLVGNFILPCSLLLGWIIDRSGFMLPALINVVSVQAFILAFWVLDIEWQYVTLLLYNIANTAVFTIQNAYVCSVGHQHIGALFAISNAVLGVGNLASDYLSLNPFGSGEHAIDTSVAWSSVFWLVACLPLYGWVAAEVFHARRRHNEFEDFMISASRSPSRNTSLSAPGDPEPLPDVEAANMPDSTGGAPTGSCVKISAGEGGASLVARVGASGSAGAPLLLRWVSRNATPCPWEEHQEPEISWNPVVTVNPAEWEAKLRRTVEAGREKVALLLDFDRTITRCFKDDGLRSLDCHDILASIPKITSECKRMMERLVEKYYPIEIDPNLSNEEKIPHMVEWYSLVNHLLENQRLEPDDVRTAVADCKDFMLRRGVEDLIRTASTKGIPIIIISAGLGNIIEEVVEQRVWPATGLTGNPWDSMRVLSNNLQWDADGNHTGFSEPLIHMYNKSLQDAPPDVLLLLEGRDKVILCGDGTGDLTMANGLQTSDVLKIGFLNEKISERLPKYIGPNGYDRVILNDGTFEPVLEIVKNL